MSSERAGTPTHDKWQVVYEYDSFEDAEGAYVGAERPYDRALPGSPTIRRAGVHTSGTLNREKARDVLRRLAPVTGSSRIDAYLDALEACVVPDPRIEALLREVDVLGKGFNGWVAVDDVRAFLRGNQ